MEGAAMPVGPIHHRRNAKSMALVQFKAPGDIKMGKLHAFSARVVGVLPSSNASGKGASLARAGTAMANTRRERMRLKLLLKQNGFA
jgi:hypothetical protein